VTIVRNPHGSKGIIVLTLVTMLIVGALAIGGCSSDEPVTEPDTTGESTGSDSGSDTPATGSVDAEAILEQQCTLCHDASRIYLQSDATDWADVIDRMNAEHSKTQPGSEELLSAEQQQALIDFMKSRTQSAGEKVVREKCVECHDLTNITKQAQGTDWSSVIDRMVDEHDASLTEAEQQDALNFLRGQ